MNKIVHTCLNCNKKRKLKASYAKRAKYCSKKCMYEYIKKNKLRSKENNSQWKGGKIIMPCMNCGKIMERDRCDLEYYSFLVCSKKCLSLSQRKRIKKNCLVCDKEFEVRLSFKKQKYCCKECQGRGQTGKNNCNFNHNGLEEIQEYIQEKGGKCLSTKYKNNHTKMIFECKNKHIFKMTTRSIKSGGQWCPHCLYKNEEECRQIFEKIFHVKFLKVRPDWLTNYKTGYRLELDGYNEDLNIGFEYQGEQHYKECNYFRHWTLKEIQERDELKRKLCKENNVLLIEIPYNVPKKERKEYIISKYLGER